MKLFIFSIFILLVVSYANCEYTTSGKLDLYMPNVKPHKFNLYLCTQVKLNAQKSYYIGNVNKNFFIYSKNINESDKANVLNFGLVGFEPNASMSFVHHMIVYGCSLPSKSKPVWNCGQMAARNYNEETASPCADGSTILYAWARDAPKLDLPEGVAFNIGKNTNIKYLVLQVHYNHVEKFQSGETDRSGVDLLYTYVRPPKLAGVYLMGTRGRIRAHTTESMETACPLTEDKKIHPFRFRTHTHELGVRVAGYRVRKVKGVENWTLIGEQDPLKPQMFYPTENDMVIEKGDFMAATCKMDATHRNRDTAIGPTAENEMCNFYIMYWVENATPLKNQFCFSSGPPFYYWRETFQSVPAKERRTYNRTDIDEEW